jgi:hypothetical protein
MMRLENLGIAIIGSLLVTGGSVTGRRPIGKTDARGQKFLPAACLEKVKAPSVFCSL